MPQRKQPLVLPVVALGAEHLAIGYLMRRNILAYKAPPGHEGYDLICIHPDPKKNSKIVKVQVKSRYATDCNRAFPIKEKTLDAFDYCILAFLNLGYYYRKKETLEGFREPEFYTLPRKFIKRHYDKVAKGWQLFKTRHLDMEAYKNEKGFELIAKDLGIKYPKKDKAK